VEAFSYLSVLLSIIIGLAITQILAGLRGMVLWRSNVRMFWPVLLWALTLLLLNVQSWWAMFDLREVQAWTFAAFAMVLAQATVQYLLAAIVLPDFSIDAQTDLATHYWAHARWFFGLFITLLLISLAKAFVLYGHATQYTDLAFHILFIVLSAVALVLRRDWYHKLLALFSAGLFCAYIVVLFAQLR